MGKVINSMRKLSERGYSVLEVMFAGVILGFIALAILPALFTLNDAMKVNSFRSQCVAIVRAKMQEYVNGVGADQTTLVAPTVATGYIPTGFEYTKTRFYNFSPSYCYGDNPRPPAGAPGFRERINSNRIVAPDASPNDNPLTPDVPDRLQGFQLYVNIRHYNPRVNPAFHPRRQCPNTTPATPADYQFFRVGDALEVTVTGMIRVRPDKTNGGRGGSKWGPFDDLDATTPNPRLVCSATQLIYPPRLPFRYYLGTDGKIRNYQATLSFTSGLPNASIEAMESHFRNLWSMDATATGTINSFAQANIRSFAISPENNTAYVLRPGELTQYTNCSDSTTTMTTVPPAAPGSVVFQQTPNCSLADADIKTWRVDSNIDNIAVDFQDLTVTTDDLLFGLLNSGSQSANALRRINLDSPGPGLTTLIDDSRFALPTNAPRIRGVFVVPSFPYLTLPNVPNLFYFDNSCAESAVASASRTSHCVSVFSSGDITSSNPAKELPSQVEGISY